MRHHYYLPLSAAHEDAIATAFSQRFENYLRYDHHRGRWHLWDEAHWKLEETGLALQFAREECRRAVNALALDDGDAVKIMRASTSAAIIRFAQIDRHHAVTSEIWDPDQFALGTPGGTVNLRTGLLRPAERRDYVTRLTSVAPIAAANCPTWLRFLDDATQGDAGLVRFLQQISGYCLTGDTREHVLFFIYGPGGNGKSVFLNTLNGILANYAETAVMDAFTASAHDKHSTDIAMMRGARLVSVSETEEGRAWAETRVKQLTGGDKVTARFMRQDNFTFIPRFKLVIVGNHKPVLSNVDDAAKRRFNIIPFTCKPPRPDKQLEAKLQTEWPGILRWMINGCLDWQKNGLVRPRIVSEATAEYFDDQDMVTVSIDGIAASAASYIAMAGDEIIMPENAFLMIHDPSGMVMGTAVDMRSMAKALEKIGTSLIKGYAAKSGKAEKDIAKLMAKETWFDAAEAVDMGLADTLAQPVKMAASFDVSGFQNTPPEIVAAVKAAAKPVVVVEPAPKEAPAAKADPAPDPATIRTDAMSYAKTVVDLCSLAGQPQMAAGFLAAETSLEDIRKTLIDARAKDDPDISSNHPQPGKHSDARPWADVIANTFKRKG